jgi:peptidoglycan/LPS O-acetylase OafA/YrhL
MNATPTAGPQRGGLPQRWAPPSPGLALGLGIVLVFLGAWTLSDGELPQPLGWACVVVGAAFLLTGAVAKGVAWGLDLHAEAER